MSTTRQGTRWGRAGIASLVGFGVTAGMAAMVFNGVFAGTDATIVIQNASAQFYSSEIDAVDAGFGMTPVNTQTGTKAVLRAGFAKADLNGLCITKTEGPFTITLKAGDGTSALDVHANNASFDLTSLRGDGANGIVLYGSDQVGLATTDITTLPGQSPYDSNPLGAPTANKGQGWTGIDVSSAKLYNVSGTIWQAQITGNINLPKLQILVNNGGCPTPPSYPN